MSGYTNRLCKIDLTTQTTTYEETSREYLKHYVGGSSLAARLFFDAKGYEIPPLAPESPLFIMPGPMTGTTFPGTSRFVMCARSPLTNIWGESASGGAFGAVLKKAGLDGIQLTGKAEQPTVLCIDDGHISLESALELWGCDTYQTIDRLLEKHSGNLAVKVLAIGPAGENLVKYAAVCNDKAHYIGRTGMGAVMGSKHLKAIVVKGTGHVPVSDKDAYRSAREAAMATIKSSMISDTFHSLGTAAAMDMGMMTGDVPIKNWSIGVDYAMADAIGGPAINDRLLTKRKACYACPIACKPVIQVNTPGYELKEIPGPEYETCASFGSMIMNDNLEALAIANDLCNRLGIDTISCGATIAFIMEVFEKGLLTREEMDGLDLAWGNIAAAMDLVSRIAYRKGFGNRAAEGSHRLAQSIGPSAMDSTVTVKGLELPMHDPRAFHGQGLSYMSSNRGACHLQHSVQAVEQGMVAWPETGLEEDYPATESADKAAMVCIAEDIGQMANALCICHFVHWAMGMEPLMAGFNAIIGHPFDMQLFLESGRRAWFLKRALNNLMGVTSDDDHLPKRILTPLSEGGAQGSVPNESLMKQEYYQIRG
ncbi:aldehyde ferredoxin oxidoreductase family protein, partial [Thermodesulfobacteriota bacterium]